MVKYKEMEGIYSLTNNILSKEFLLKYHIGEEILIALICLLIAVRAFRTSGIRVSGDQTKSSRIFLVGAGFFILGSSSLIHAIIHASHSNLNLLYQTLLAYSLGLFILISTSRCLPYCIRRPMNIFLFSANSGRWSGS